MFSIMDKHQLSLVGTIVAAIGCLTILLTWLEIYYEDSYRTLFYSYTGITLITSGDFTNPNGIFYGWAGIVGVYTPTLICIAFACMATRFIARVNRPYHQDVLASGILIIIASFYMMYWVGPGSYYETGSVETHDFGMGPFVSLIVAFIGIVVAYAIDRADAESKQSNDYAPSTSFQQSNGYVGDSQPVYAMYCPKCGHGLTQQESTNTNFCKYCGANIKEFTSDSEGEQTN